MLKKCRKWKWVITTVICFLAVNLLPAAFIEHYYSNGIFRFIRKVFDYSFGKLPFPSYYLFVAFMVLVLFKWILRIRPLSFAERIFRIFSFVCFMITIFFILWGFNYGRIPLDQKLDLNIQPLTEEQLLQETTQTVGHLDFIREKIKKDTSAIPEIVFINNIEENSRTALNRYLDTLHYPTSNIRARFILEDVFLFFNVGGQYLPFTGEGNVDDGVHYSKKPFYMAHEMAHGSGFTEEADCNFLAYVSGVQSDKLSLQYSAEFDYLLYLLPEVRERNRQQYDSILQSMPQAIQKDLERLKAYNIQHTYRTGFIGEIINNFYLKIMGVPEGTRNYDKMVLLVYAWKLKHNAEFSTIEK